MNQLMDNLQYNSTRKSTKCNYLGIWRQFNNFVIKLDHQLKSWEDCTSLYSTYLILKGIQSSTLKSHISAIKHSLIKDKYKWNDDLVLLNTLVKACKLSNDTIRVKLPIQFNLFEALLFELERIGRYLKCYSSFWFECFF